MQLDPTEEGKGIMAAINPWSVFSKKTKTKGKAKGGGKKAARKTNGTGKRSGAWTAYVGNK
jgi:hypothetical protein